MDLRDGISLEPDPVWTDRYEDVRERVLDVAGDHLLDVFHVGSTAIPDLPGKPALDVLAVAPDSDSLDAAATAVADLEGYDLEADGDETALAIRWADDHAVFVKLHVRGDEKVRNQLLFREYLRETPAARREYERVKREAAADHPDDPAAYTQAKADVVRSLLEDAEAAGYEDRLPSVG